MKPAFIVTVHNSKQFRPNGHKLLDIYLTSLYSHLKIPFDVFILENASDTKYDFPKNAHYRYFPDQNGGMTRCWNEGVKMAIENGNDILCVTNEDLIFNETINNFFSVIETHSEKNISVYGPICDNPTTFPPQQGTTVKSTIHEITWNQYPIHGWFNAFTSEYYFKYSVNGDIFDRTRKWRGQEQYQKENWKNGAKSFIVKSCLIHHEHIGSWRKTETIIK